MNFASFSIENLPESERLVPCPYNNAHMVVQHRMPKHLIKCRQSTSIKNTQTCRFNSMHVVPTEEIVYHENQCPDRLLVERFIEVHTNVINKNASDSEIRSTSSSQILEDEEENWENDGEAKDGVAEVLKKAQNSNVILNIQHGTPSEKKMRRAQEADRLRRIRNT